MNKGLLANLQSALAALPEKEKQGLFSQQWEAQQSMFTFNRISYGGMRSKGIDLLDYHRDRIKAILAHYPVEPSQIIDFLDNSKGMKFERYEEIVQALKEGMHPQEIIEHLNQQYRYEPEGVDEMIQNAAPKKKQASGWTLSPFTPIP
jgi:uncharacterized protein (DUF433 family)